MRSNPFPSKGNPMSPAFPSRRRAEQFDALLEGALSEAPTAELAELLAFAESVWALPEVAPRAEFAADLRERLMAEAPAALATPAETAETAESGRKDRLTVGGRAPSRTRRDRRIGIAIAAFSVVGATAASAVASQGTLPGDTLYPVKRLIEDAHTTLAMGEEAKAQTLLSHANTRLEEARELGTEDGDTGPISQALEDYSAQADEASDLLLEEYAAHQNTNTLTDLQTFTQQGVTTIGELTGVLPESVNDALAGAAQTLVTINEAVNAACPSCGLDGGLAELPPTVLDLLSSTTTGLQQTAAAVGTSASTPVGKGPVADASKSAQPKTQPAGGTASTGPIGSAGTDAGEKVTKQGQKVLKPSSAPTSVGGVVGDVGGAVGDTVGGVGDTIGGVGDSVGGAVGDTVGGVGDTVGGVGDTVGGVVGGVGDTVDGVVGGLLGGLTGTQSPKP